MVKILVYPIIEMVEEIIAEGADVLFTAFCKDLSLNKNSSIHQYMVDDFVFFTITFKNELRLNNHKIDHFRIIHTAERYELAFMVFENEQEQELTVDGLQNHRFNNAHEVIHALKCIISDCTIIA